MGMFTKVLKASGKTDEQFCQEVGITHRALVSYKYGERRPRPLVLDRIGKSLNLSKDELWEMFYQ